MRFFVWLHAKLHRRFWLPCPICGNKFSGAEIEERFRREGGIWTTHNGVAVCPRCADRKEAEGLAW